MAKKYFPKALSVGLSLALCASLVAPSFAASFQDLQDVIDGNGRYQGSEISREDNKITLNGNVTYEQSDGSRTDIRVNGGKDITLDLNGNTITAAGNGSAIYVYGSGTKLTLQDSSEGKNGQVTGGSNAGIYVQHGASVEMQGGTITGNTANSGGGVVVDGANSSFVMKGGEISGNTANQYGGGVYATNSGSFTMEGGKVSGNTSKASGGGVAVNGGSFTMTRGEISENAGGASNLDNDRYASGGGGVWVGGSSNSSFTMKGGTITHNYISGSKASGGGVAVHKGSAVMTGGSITDNGSTNGPGVAIYNNGSSFKMSGGEINTGSLYGSVSVYADSGSFEMEDGVIKGEITVSDNGANVDITGGNVSQLNEKYLEGKGLVKNEDGTYNVQELGPDGHIWSAWDVTPAEIGIEGTRERHCLVDGCDEIQIRTIPALEEEIDEPAVPLASGPVTQGEFIDYLWRHEGEPEAEAEGDHEYAAAIAWAQSIGIISDETFEADELVTVALVRDILTKFAAYTDMAMPELTALTGDDDEAVLNCDEILAEFFGEDAAE